MEGEMGTTADREQGTVPRKDLAYPMWGLGEESE